nr:transcriptional regulator [Saccharothrix espanaensis]
MQTIGLRTETFRRAANLAGLRSEYALAKAMNVNRSTVARVLAGDLRPGGTFIAGALTALKPMAFEDLFEVVPSAT